ncbi:Drug/metabolite transporter superfamily [Rhodotorula diobovata]|uniref:Drug/metabolite transporter superfamily n=1 Tax=Rhodotorula diobovata TaxID=5288 RepID=A0A5C5FXT4_9BASI|nr:Drug/metabolite transporter superfamily [Rhodotorula diobovata]
MDNGSDLDEDGLDDHETLVHKAQPANAFRLAHQPRASVTGLLSGEHLDDAERRRRISVYEDVDEGVVERIKAGWVRRTGAAQGLVRRNEGLLLIATAQLGFALINMCVKLLERDVQVPVWELILIRMAMTWVGCYTYLRWSGDPHPFAGPPGVRLLLALRGFVGFFGLYTNYAALQYLAMSDTSALFYLSPILVGILGFLLLREPYSRTEALVGLASLSGTVFIAKPTFLFASSGVTEDIPGHKVTAEQRALGITLVLAGCFTSSLVAIIIRFIGTRASPLHSISYFCIYSVIVSALYPLIFDAPPVFRLSPRFFGLLLPIGVLGFVAQALTTRGLVLEKAGRGSLASYTGLLFTLVIERVAFHKTPDAWSLLGALIIVGGAVRVALEPKKGAGAAPVVEGTELARAQVAGREGYDRLATAEEGRERKTATERGEASL